MNTLRARLALASGAVVLLVLAPVCAILFVLYASSLKAQADAGLIQAAEQAGTVVQALKAAAARKGAQAEFGASTTVRGAQLQILPEPVAGVAAGTPGPATDEEVEVAAGRLGPHFRTTVAPDPVRIYATRLPNTDDPVLVRVWRPVSADAPALTRAALLLAGLTLAGTAIAALAGRLGANRVLQPIRELTAAAERVARSGDPAARVRPVTGTSDEVGRLASSFDTMLAALEQSVGAQRQLVADASHELRTPLTTVITNLDLLGDGAGLADPQAPRLVADARSQAGELAGLVEDLVDLARYGQVEPHLDDVRLDLAAAAALRRAASRAPGIRVTADLQPSLVVADPAAVDRALANLIDNAIKWSPDGGLVHVSVAGDRCEVSDQGRGIPEADLPHVFERFYRARDARGLPGSGLGLAIVAQVAECHRGWVAVRSGPRGATFTIAFPPVSGTVGVDPDPTSGRPVQGRPA